MLSIILCRLNSWTSILSHSFSEIADWVQTGLLKMAGLRGKSAYEVEVRDPGLVETHYG